MTTPIALPKLSPVEEFVVCSRGNLRESYGKKRLFSPYGLVAPYLVPMPWRIPQASLLLRLYLGNGCFGADLSSSKLDIGCAGLCILQRDGVTVNKVSHVLTSLVHGHVPDDWNGMSMYLATESMRRW
jgi:hypothetical protein